MNKSDIPSNIEPRYAFCELPPLFHSLEQEGPFQRCCLCERALLDDSVFDGPYFIERIFRGAEPIVEYAMCYRCRLGQQECVSTESMTRLQDHWNEHVNQNQRAADMIDAYVRGQASVDDWTNRCVLTDLPKSQCQSRQVIGLAFGHKLMLSYLPVMISGVAIEQIQQLLSEETKGWMDDFVSDQFGMPPEFLETPPVFI